MGAARAKAQGIKCRVHTGSCQLLGFTEVKSRDRCGAGYGQRATQGPDPKSLTLRQGSNWETLPTAH